LNNVHIAIAHAARQHGLTHAVILDFDLHHGDGSQSIAWTLNNIANSGNASTKKTAGIHVPNIGYFSLHDINSYPCEDGDMDKVKNASLNLEAHGQFIHNIHLKPYNSVEEFWELYENKYYSVIAKAREFLSEASVSKPKKNGREYKAGVFISAGFDASEHESSGMQRHAVNVPTSFYARFTSDALALAEQYCEGRVLSVLEGGYSDRALITGIMAHLAGLACPSPTTVSGFVPPSTGLLPVPEPYATRPSSADRGWDPEWWGSENLGELERYYEKMTFKKVVTDKPSTSYLSATTASIARSETPRRVVSSAGAGNSSPLPPPVIPWEVRAFELSRKIIPEFQESVEIPPIDKSAKNKRHSVAVVPDSSTRVLRDRKAKTPDAAAPLDVRRRRTTTGGAVSTASSRAPSRAPSRAMSTRGTTPLPPRDLEPIPIATGRRVVSASAGPTVAAPRTLARKSSVVGNSVGQRSPPVLLRKASLTTFDGTRTATTTSPSASSGSGSASGNPSPRAAVAPKKEVSDELVKKFAKIKITYKNREKEEEILRMERQKEELERKLEAEKKRLAAGGGRASKKTPTTTASSRSPSNSAMPNGGGVARARSVSGAGSVRAQVNGLDKIGGQGNVNGGVAGGHAAEKETKMVTPPLGGAQPADRTYRGGDIKFAATGLGPEPGPPGFMGRTG
jgi:histone deacetylase HOS3